MEQVIENCRTKMQNAYEILQKEFNGIRAGRANANLLEPIKVDAYGNYVPLAQVGTLGAPEPRLLTVQVWDKGLVKAVEKAIRESSLGVSPIVDGQLIRIALPDMTEQRRQELAKLSAKYSEESKICMRNVRREANESLKKAQKDKLISEDELHRLNDKIQELTDQFIKNIDQLLSAKQKDIMQI